MGRRKIPVREYRLRRANVIQAVARGTIASAAKECGLSDRTVRDILKRAGLRVVKMLTRL